MRPRQYCTPLLCIAMASFLLLAGCAPVISKGALKKVDQGLDFAQLLKDPEAYREKTVLLGGSIIETKNLPDRTLIFVLQRPLGFRKKPTGEDVSKGRFIVYVSGFLDPAIYRPNRKITVVGSVVGKEVRPLGEIKYNYPVIEKRELYLWPAEESYMTESRVHFGFGVVKGF